MKQIALFLILSSAILIGCSKNVKCGNALACVRNLTSDTIYYCWGCNSYNDYVAPGKEVCTNVGEVEIKGTYEHTQTITFNTRYSSYAIRVDECQVVKTIN